MAVVLGQKICDNCRAQLKQLKGSEGEYFSDVRSDVENDSDALEMTSAEQSLIAESLNDSLCTDVGMSAMKVWKVFNENTSYIEQKSLRIYHIVRKKLYELAGVPCPEIDNTGIINLHDYSDIMNQLKTALPNFPREQKLQALTLLCDKMSVKKLSSFFGISERL